MSFVVEFLRPQSTERITMNVDDGTTLKQAINMMPSSERVKLYSGDGVTLLTEFRYVTGSQIPVSEDTVIARNPNGTTMFFMSKKTKGNE